MTPSPKKQAAKLGRALPALALAAGLVLAASPPTFAAHYSADRGHQGGPTNTPEVPIAGLLPLGLGAATWLIYKKRSRSQAK